ncbi:MAG: hypothetical protein SGJ05_07685 [bacterium]|nr:hypothetical protein [bacterium]
MKHLTKALIFTVTVLISYLVTALLEDRVLLETERFRPGTATLLGMGIIVLVFVPVFAYTERITEAVIRSSLRQSKTGAGPIIGAILFVAVVLTILFALYLDRWFDMSIADLF